MYTKETKQTLKNNTDYTYILRVNTLKNASHMPSLTTLNKRRYFFIIKPTRCTSFKNLLRHETLHVSDSSSVYHQEFIHCTLVTGMCHTGLQTVSSSSLPNRQRKHTGIETPKRNYRKQTRQYGITKYAGCLMFF